MYRNVFFDADGSLTKKDDGTNVHSYAYDFRNLMTDYDGPGTNNDSTYKYDAFSRRITKDVNGTKTAYFHDALNVVAEYNGSSQLQRTYVTPGLDQNLTMTASGSTYYYLTDALGSVRQLIDANEATQNSYDYEAFGKVYGSPTENLTQPSRFTGRAWDPEAHLHYYRRRVYYTSLGRFGSRDRGDAAVIFVYSYVRNSPLRFADPLGLKAHLIIEGMDAGQFARRWRLESMEGWDYGDYLYPDEKLTCQQALAIAKKRCSSDPCLKAALLYTIDISIVYAGMSDAMQFATHERGVPEVGTSAIPHMEMSPQILEGTEEQIGTFCHYACLKKNMQRYGTRTWPKYLRRVDRYEFPHLPPIVMEVRVYYKRTQHLYRCP